MDMIPRACHSNDREITTKCLKTIDPTESRNRHTFFYFFYINNLSKCMALDNSNNPSLYRLQCFARLLKKKERKAGRGQRGGGRVRVKHWVLMKNRTLTRRHL